MLQNFLSGFYFFAAHETSSDEESWLAPVVPTRGEEVFESPTDAGDVSVLSLPSEEESLTHSVLSDEQYWGGFSGPWGTWVFY